ncbi:hypothetical protein CLOSTASPAR_02883, partial [[Clostridium] asparagiforme DSM 15981]
MTDMGERKKRERINWNTLKKLGHYLAAERWYLLAAVCLAVAGNLLALAGPMLSGYAVDAISPGPGRVDFNQVFYYAKWMIVCYGAAFVCSYSLAALMIHVSQRIVRRMRRDVF